MRPLIMPITDEKAVHKVLGLYFLKDFFFFDVDHFLKSLY